MFRLHEGSLLSAAIAFYALLAIAPLGVLGLAGAAWILGEEAAHGELSATLGLFFDEGIAGYVSATIERASHQGAQWWAPVLSFVFLVFVSTRLFWMLRAALNQLWGIRSTQPPGFRGVAAEVLRRRLLAFAMVFFVALAVIASAVIRGALTLAQEWIGGSAELYGGLGTLGTVVLLAAMVTLVFMLLPDARIAFRDAAVGGVVTALGAGAGAVLIGRWMTRIASGSSFGAAGSAIVLLMWVYYTTQIFFFGAIFTAVWARRSGRDIEPRAYADRIVLQAEVSTGDFADKLSAQWTRDVHALDENNHRSSDSVAPAARDSSAKDA